MTPLKIKMLLMQKGTSIRGVARIYAQQEKQLGKLPNLESIRKKFSMCVHGEREYPPLQDFIADIVEKPVEQLFPSRRRKAA